MATSLETRVCGGDAAVEKPAYREGHIVSWDGGQNLVTHGLERYEPFWATLSLGFLKP